VRRANSGRSYLQFIIPWKFAITFRGLESINDRPTHTLDFDVQTNRTTARIFPAVLDVENPVFQEKLDHLVLLTQKLINIGSSGAPAPLKALQRVPFIFAFVGEILAMYLMKPVDSGSLDFAEQEAKLVY
jgi:magnesium-protoporphyrin IX monomethyl ester (oxidative) cyclase